MIARADAGDLSVARALHTATALSDGRVLIVGGITTGNDSAVGPLASAEIWAPGPRE